jgi:predicted NBD/HSP70 family sugar kinase
MYIGVAIRSSSIALGFVEDTGKLGFHNSFPLLPEEGADSIILDLVFSIKTIAETVPLELFNVTLDAIGLTIIGTLDKEGRIAGCVIKSLENIDLRETLQKNFNIDVFVASADDALQMAHKEVEGHGEQSAAIIAAGLLCKYQETIPQEYEG